MLVYIDLDSVKKIMETSHSLVIEFRNGSSVHLNYCIVSIEGDKQEMVISN